MGFLLGIFYLLLCILIILAFMLLFGFIGVLKKEQSQQLETSLSKLQTSVAFQSIIANKPLPLGNLNKKDFPAKNNYIESLSTTKVISHVISKICEQYCFSIWFYRHFRKRRSPKHEANISMLRDLSADFLFLFGQTLFLVSYMQENILIFLGVNLLLANSILSAKNLWKSYKKQIYKQKLEENEELVCLQLTDQKEPKLSTLEKTINIDVTVNQTIINNSYDVCSIPHSLQEIELKGRELTIVNLFVLNKNPTQISVYFMVIVLAINILGLLSYIGLLSAPSQADLRLFRIIISLVVDQIFAKFLFVVLQCVVLVLFPSKLLPILLNLIEIPQKSNAHQDQTESKMIKTSPKREQYSKSAKTSPIKQFINKTFFTPLKLQEETEDLDIRKDLFDAKKEQLKKQIIEKSHSSNDFQAAIIRIEQFSSQKNTLNSKNINTFLNSQEIINQTDSLDPDKNRILKNLDNYQPQNPDFNYDPQNSIFQIIHQEEDIGNKRNPLQNKPNSPIYDQNSHYSQQTQTQKDPFVTNSGNVKFFNNERNRYQNQFVTEVNQPEFNQSQEEQMQNEKIQLADQLEGCNENFDQCQDGHLNDLFYEQNNQNSEILKQQNSEDEDDLNSQRILQEILDNYDKWQSEQAIILNQDPQPPQANKFLSIAIEQNEEYEQSIAHQNSQKSKLDSIKNTFTGQKSERTENLHSIQLQLEDQLNSLREKQVIQGDTAEIQQEIKMYPSDSNHSLSQRQNVLVQQQKMHQFLQDKNMFQTSKVLISEFQEQIPSKQGSDLENQKDIQQVKENVPFEDHSFSKEQKRFIKPQQKLTQSVNKPPEQLLASVNTTYLSVEAKKNNLIDDQKKGTCIKDHSRTGNINVSINICEDEEIIGNLNNNRLTPNKACFYLNNEQTTDKTTYVDQGKSRTTSVSFVQHYDNQEDLLRKIKNSQKKTKFITDVDNIPHEQLDLSQNNLRQQNFNSTQQKFQSCQQTKKKFLLKKLQFIKANPKWDKFAVQCPYMDILPDILKREKEILEQKEQQNLKRQQKLDQYHSKILKSANKTQYVKDLKNNPFQEFNWKNQLSETHFDENQKQYSDNARLKTKTQHRYPDESDPSVIRIPLKNITQDQSLGNTYLPKLCSDIKTKSNNKKQNMNVSSTSYRMKSGNHFSELNANGIQKFKYKCEVSPIKNNYC